MKLFNTLKTVALSLSFALTASVSHSANAADQQHHIDNRENKAISRQIINAPADQVWAQIGRIDGIENFIPEVFESTSVKGQGIGAERICVHHNGRVLVEKILAFDEVSMTLTYTLIKGGTLPVNNIYNTVQVHPISDTQSLLVWESKYDQVNDTANAEMIKNLTKETLAYVTTGAKRYIEGLPTKSLDIAQPNL